MPVLERIRSQKPRNVASLSISFAVNPPHPILQVNVAEQLARSIVAASHVPSPNLVGANESRSTARRQPPFFNSLLGKKQSLTILRI
jgi:hypothetical protein